MTGRVRRMPDDERKGYGLIGPYDPQSRRQYVVRGNEPWCPRCGRQMVLRHQGWERNWECPRCRTTIR
jgi:ribosomal protein L37AE/L43A